MTTSDAAGAQPNGKVGPRGVDLLHDPALNKGTAFTAEERERLKLRGLLPPQIADQAIQVQRVLANLAKKSDDLEKYIFLMALQDRNETLFYRVVLDHLQQMMPIIYTPTVGQACQEYGVIFRRPRGLFISAEDKGRIGEVLANWPHRDVRVIVATDGERILGLGDLGANGMGIPVGKLSLYTACAGIHPLQTLPVTLDVGTNNSGLRENPLYIGLNQPRMSGEAYDALIEEFVDSVRRQFPKALLQFEDFANHNAFKLLEKYGLSIRTFNDDIQGTAGVALAGLYAALRLTGGELRDQTLLFLGAGEAGIGIADLFVAALQDEGLTAESARARCWFVDSRGLVVRSRTDLAPHKVPYAKDHPPASDLLAALESLRPSVLIGVSGTPRTFTREVIEAMARINRRPVVFALSNPTSRSECSAEEAYRWSNGTAVFASGSPFPDVTLGGQTFEPGQGNNAYIFPGLGLGVVVSEARLVSDRMFLEAARALAGEVSEGDLARGRIYPSLDRIRDVSAAIAAAVARVAVEEGLADAELPDGVKKAVQAAMYWPDYAAYS